MRRSRAWSEGGKSISQVLAEILRMESIETPEKDEVLTVLEQGSNPFILFYDFFFSKAFYIAFKYLLAYIGTVVLPSIFWDIN